jgi:hypothetical protein
MGLLLCLESGLLLLWLLLWGSPFSFGRGVQLQRDASIGCIRLGSKSPARAFFTTYSEPPLHRCFRLDCFLHMFVVDFFHSLACVLSIVCSHH